MNLEIEDKRPEIGIVIITGSYCIPGMKSFDDSARQVWKPCGP